METVYLFASIGAVVALFPGASFFLVPMELFMIYLISDKYKAFELPTFLAMGAAIVTISTFLKLFSSFLHAVPLLGQAANAFVAFCFIGIVGFLAEKYYSSKAKGRGAIPAG